jgi:proline iminopeptidase
MPLRALVVCFLAACASSRTPSAVDVVPFAAIAPGLQPGSHEVVLRGVRFFYRVGGNAPSGTPPVVFLAGGPGQGSAHFDALAGSFMERELRMVYYDQRGSGFSERPWNRDYALATLVNDIESLRRELGMPQLALLGHSFGTVLALEYAAKYPNKVSHLIVVAGLWDTQVQCPLRLARFAELRPDVYERVRNDTIAQDGSRRNECDIELRARNGLGDDRRRFDLQTIFTDSAVATRIDSVHTARNVVYGGELNRAVMAELGNRYRFTQFDVVTMPVLVIAGRFDGAALPAGLRELALRLPRARYVEFEKSGHFVYLDEPDRFAKEVTAFVRSR